MPVDPAGERVVGLQEIPIDGGDTLGLHAAAFRARALREHRQPEPDGGKIVFQVVELGALIERLLHCLSLREPRGLVNHCRAPLPLPCSTSQRCYGDGRWRWPGTFIPNARSVRGPSCSRRTTPTSPWP